MKDKEQFGEYYYKNSTILHDHVDFWYESCFSEDGNPKNPDVRDEEIINAALDIISLIKNLLEPQLKKITIEITDEKEK